MKTILIIEDEPDIMLAVSMFLEGEGYTVYGAENGFVALELLKKHDLPHLILLDMVMPVMNGWQFASEFLQLYGRKVPIIVMTAAADAEQRAKDTNANGWIEKPFSLDSLLVLIKKHERDGVLITDQFIGRGRTL